MIVNAEIVSVGTELLLGQIVDTNSAEIAQRLAELGINVYFHSSVGDNPVRLAMVLATALTRSDIVIVTGGLGPTEDDITKEALAGVTGRPLELHPDALRHVQSYFQRVGREMTDNNRRQAMIPRGGKIIDNPRGTAPGVYLTVGGKHVFCVPGVPTEMRTMLLEGVLPMLATVRGNGEIVSKTLKFYGIGESALETEVMDLLRSENPTVAPYAGLGEVKLRVTARAHSADEARRMIEPVVDELFRRVGKYHYGYDDDTLESVVAGMLTERGMTLATAESCTGGLVAHRMTNIPGSSAYFNKGWITYSNDAKARELGVDPKLIEEHGAVSEQVARAMAVGALERASASVAVATTGVAGPGGGTAAKPVGLVWFAVATAGGEVSAHSRQFQGRREDIKWRSSSEAINFVRSVL